MTDESFFLEIASSQLSKKGERAPGDVFSSIRHGGGRYVCVLADGLGSGIKAHVLASLTATMASRFIAEDFNAEKAARIIMRTLPVCSERHIGYSTFTILDLDERGRVTLIEYDNPRTLIFSGGRAREIPRTSIVMNAGELGGRVLSTASFQAELDDRIIVCSDGITQSGLGSRHYPLGWGIDELEGYVSSALEGSLQPSSRNLARWVVSHARTLDGGKSGDDMTCAVIRFRKPRKMLVVTGPPFHAERDAVLAERLSSFEGKRIVCGGTTAGIIARQWGVRAEVDLATMDRHIPPSSRMDGVDLVTEGALTLSAVSRALQKRLEPEQVGNHAAGRLFQMMMESDSIHFIVGTRVNEAHQDPALPEELDIRRNLIRRITDDLRTLYLKHASFELI